MKFKNIFEGLKIAYGQYQKGDVAANGDKQKGKAFIVRQNVSDDLWEKHLQQLHKTIARGAYTLPSRN